MDIVTILRELRRRRRSVVVAFVVAMIAGVLVMYQVPSFKSRSHDVGAATTQILLDTPSSQVVAVAPKGSDTVGMRANLLASLMVDGDVESFIARRAGLQPNQIAGTTDAATDTSPGSPLTAGPPPTGARPYTLTTHILSDVTNMPLPIIEVDVRAPTGAGAVRLAQAAVLGLKDYLNSTAAQEDIPDVQRLQVDGLGVPQGSEVIQGPTSLIAVLVAVLVFVLGCASILGGAALRRRWRAAAEREALEAQGRLPADEPFGEPDHDRFAADVDITAAEPSRVATAAQVPDEGRAVGESLLSILGRSAQVDSAEDASSSISSSSSGDPEIEHTGEPADGDAIGADRGGATRSRLATRRAFYFSVGQHD